MFERLKKVFVSSAAPREVVRADAVSEWAGTHGFSYSGPEKGQGLVLSGKIRGKPWKLESGAASRDYIRGEELRARAELGIDGDMSVLIMSRPLKETLEKRAYAIYTDTLQTTADPSLPEEMRWLAMYEEFGWSSLVPDFWERYTVLADQRDHALAWIDGNLAELLLHWPQPGVDAQTPFILMLLRGKCYLRMQYNAGDIASLQHAAVIFTSACEAALASAKPDISL
ncbi:MAG: hypothetical protein Q8M51_01415 [Polaromonas sp.]|uniref:hypothetical protein n=1 Tax=Polaromonas sp. TaxID=1869339 RepID=UPI00272EFBF6|nr:hypothetical protein [Polaromonas sp.]MDP1739486.1 hypothetical protein [Polaromonas sp.]MDP1953020.1 hypothetical protein [Polaromonas sp.]MDP3354509.1 hypothetical protein [Polaromonas sp.]MDP3751489.1 hypothetical protein [Polaromonas sp.]